MVTAAAAGLVIGRNISSSSLGKETFNFSGGLRRWVEDLVDSSWNTRLEDSDVLMCFSTLEHGYFRSPGRGGENQKIVCLFFSIGRMNIRRRAFERSMLGGYQKIIFMTIASFFTSLRLIKVAKIAKIAIRS